MKAPFPSEGWEMWMWGKFELYTDLIKDLLFSDTDGFFSLFMLFV